MTTNEGNFQPDNEGVRVVNAGISVEKQIVPDGNAVQTLRYEVQSTRETAVWVRVRDSVPGSLPREAVGFHPDYYGDDWSAAGNRVEFTRQIEPESSLVTVLGVQLPDGMNATELAGNPSIQVETDSAGLDSIANAEQDSEEQPEAIDTSTNSAVDSHESADRSAFSAGSEPELALDLDDEVPDPDSSVPPSTESTAAGESLLDPASTDGDSEAFEFDNAPESAGSTASESDHRADTEDSASTDRVAGAPSEAPHGEAGHADESTLAATLAQELRAGQLDEGDRTTLKRELGPSTSDSTNALLDHVQSKLSTKREQLEAEIQSLESSVEQLYGVKADAEALDGLQSTVNRLEHAKADAEALETLETQVEALSETAAEADRVKRLANGLDELQSAAATMAELRQLRDQFDALETSAAFDEDLEALDERVDSLVVDRVEPLEARTDSLATRADQLETRAEELESTAEALRDDLASTTDTLHEKVEQKAADDRVDDLEATVEAVRDDAATTADHEALAKRVDHLGDRTVEQTQFNEAVEELRDTTATTDDAADLRQRIDDVESMKADQTRLASLESTIESEYVAIENVDDTINRRVRRGVATVLALGVGTGALLLSLVLAATQGAGPAGAAFIAGVLVIGGWWVRIDAGPFG